MRKTLIVTTLFASATMVGCGATSPQSAEDKAFANEFKSALLNKIQGASLPNIGTMDNRNGQLKLPPTLSEEELLVKKTEVDASGGPAVFFRDKDGISINGVVFNDFEGAVANFGGDRLSGNFTYAIKNYDRTFTLKYAKAGSKKPPFTIATVQKSGASFNVITVSGKQIPGNTVIPTSDGFIVGREGSAFRYTIGDEHVKSITLPDNYHIAQHQNGDAASTGYLLLEKDDQTNGNTVSGLFSTISAIGNTLGLHQVDHYVLINLDSNKLVPMDVNLEGKEVAKYSDCKQKNAVVRKCSDVKFEEALYDKLGIPNSSHYFWAINWVNTKSGPLAIYKTSTKVKVIDINNEKVHILFSRALGVNTFQVIPNSDGSIAVQARLGFSSDRIDDIEEFIRKNTDTDLIEPMQTLGQ